MAVRLQNPNLLEVRRIVLERLHGHPVKVYLFGSRARGQSRSTSDVDVAILPETPLPPWALSEVREALEESTVPFHVDVVDLSQVSDEFRERVLQDAESWND